jgi:predicted membrane protein
MGSNTAAVRAITAVFFQRILKWVISIALTLLVISFLLTAYLAVTFSVYWWLLLIVIWPFCIIVLLVAAGLWIATSRLQSRHFTKNERRQIRAFTDKIFGITENAQMPYPLLLFMVGKDIIRGRRSSFIENTIRDSGSLKGDFEEIRRMV